MEDKIKHDLTQKFLPFHNLLKTKQIDTYIACAEQNKKKPLEFFNCYKIAQQKHNLIYSKIFKKIGICEVQNNECFENCKVSFDNNPKEFDKCSSGCFEKFSFCADNEYGAFYKEMLKGEKEWYLVKKNLN